LLGEIPFVLHGTSRDSVAMMAIIWATAAAWCDRRVSEMGDQGSSLRL
jgi:hypothetical protein